MHAERSNKLQILVSTNTRKLLNLMGQFPKLIWPYLSKFVIPLTDFSYLEVFDDNCSGYSCSPDNFSIAQNSTIKGTHTTRLKPL